MDRQVLIRNIDKRIMINKQKLVKLNDRYAKQCNNPYIVNPDFCKTNFFDVKEILDDEIEILEKKKKQLYNKHNLSVYDLEIDSTDV